MRGEAMPLPNLSRLSEPTGARLERLRRGDQPMLRRDDQDHVDAMAVHAFHNGWRDFINYGGITTFDTEAQIDAWARWHSAIFGFFAPMATLNAALGHTGQRDPQNPRKPLYAADSPLYHYAKANQGRYYQGFVKVPELKEAYMYITLNPENSRMYTQGGELRNPTCELMLLITDRDLVATNPDYIPGGTNHGPEPTDLTPADARELVVQVLVTAARYPDSLARQAWNQALTAIQTRLTGLALVERSRLGNFVQAIRSRLQSQTRLWYAFNLAGLTIPAGPEGETMLQFLPRMWQLMSADMAQTFVKASENRFATMEFLNAKQVPSFGLRHQICMTVEPDVPVIVVKKFLPTPEVPYDPKALYPSQRAPLKPFREAERSEEIGWMCGADDQEVIIAPGATYTLLQYEGSRNEPYRIIEDRERVDDMMKRWGMSGDANTRADELDAVRWFVHVTKPA